MVCLNDLTINSNNNNTFEIPVSVSIARQAQAQLRKCDKLAKITIIDDSTNNNDGNDDDDDVQNTILCLKREYPSMYSQLHNFESTVSSQYEKIR